MKIKIENLGPVQEACIDLEKKLTVFCGQNNTGKTYVSYLLYGLTQIITRIPLADDSEPLPQINKVSDTLYEGTLEYEKVLELKQAHLSNLKEELKSIFGLSQSDDIDKFFADIQVSYYKSDQEIRERILNYEITGTHKLYGVDVTITKLASSDKVKIEIPNHTGDTSLQQRLFSFVYRQVAYHPLNGATFFSVERSSIYTFNKELSIKRNDLIDHIQGLTTDSNEDPFEYLNKRSTRYPLVIRDGLKLAEDLVNESKRQSEFHQFADEIEEMLIHGKMTVSPDGEMLFTSDKHKAQSLPIHMTASIVKTLASFIFYLRHQAKKNDLVIIDEPEINLHPSSQVVLTRILARMVNKGFRLVISTHSDYIIKELNNLIMISDSKDETKEIAQKMGYDVDKEAIQLEDVGAYRFYHASENTDKVTVDNIAVEKNGIEVVAMDNVIENQSNIAEILSDTIFSDTED